MQDVRQTTDPPSDILMSHSNQRLDRPLTPSNFFGHTNRAQPPAGLSGQGELFSTPASKTIYASGSRSILNSSSNDFNLIDTESIRQGASIYSTPFTSQNAMMRNVASSPSPPVPPYHEPRFVDGGRSRYLDYYAPMTHANSSTESFFYTSDDSHFHSHSQQTSEESAMYGEHPNEATAALNPSSDLIWPSSISADQAQTQYFPNHASNTSIVSTQMPLPSKGLFSEYDIQHARFQESWPGQSSNAISTILPVSYPKKAPTYEHETSQRQFSHSPQPRRVGSSYTFNDKGFIPSNSQLPLLSSTSSPETMANLSNQRERQDVYYTREESSFSSSSASESLGGTSDALTKQGKHDDGRPKRPLNAFMIFSRARRKDLVKEKPGMKVKDVSIALAEEWRNLEKPQKEHYQELAKVVRDNFHKMHPTYVYSRRVNGARAKKARSSASIAAKSTPRRSPNFHLCNSDDGTFSPEGYTSSASSTSSFAFPKHSASFSPSDFPRPSTSSSRGDRLTPFGGSQVTASSREVTPALAPAQQRQLQPYPSVLLRPEGFHNPISRGSRSPGLPQHEAQSTHSPNVAQGVDSFKSPSPRPRSEVSMKGRAGWPKELSATIATSQPLCPMADSTSPMTNSAYFQLDQHDCGQINHAFPPKSRCSSSPSLPSSSFDSPLPVLRPGTASIFGPYYHERDAQPVTGTGLTAAHCRAISSGTVHNGHSLGHILQGSGVYAQESQVDTAPSSSDAWSLGPTTTTIPYLNHGQSISTHAGPHQGHLFEPTAPPLQAAPESEAGSHH